MSEVSPPAVEETPEVEEVKAEEEPDILVEDAKDWVALDNGESSLDITQASTIAAEIGATVILIAGTQDAGKTTLLVELYAQFLKAPCASLRFVGSKTLDAFDYRQFASRLESGNEESDTERTGESDMRMLHLRLSDESGNHQALMPSDLKGELFEDLINGLDGVENVIPLANRADKTIILVDGQQIAAIDARQTAIFRARLLIGALTEPGGIRGGQPLLIALSKRDLLDEVAADWYKKEAEGLTELASERGCVDVQLLDLGARPRNGSAAIGLADVLNWMWAPVPSPPVTNPTLTAHSTRVFLAASLT